MNNEFAKRYIVIKIAQFISFLIVGLMLGAMLSGCGIEATGEAYVKHYVGVDVDTICSPLLPESKYLKCLEDIPKILEKGLENGSF